MSLAYKRIILYFNAVPNIYIKLPYFQTISCTQILEGTYYKKKNAAIPSEYMTNADCRQHFP